MRWLVLVGLVSCGGSSGGGGGAGGSTSTGGGSHTPPEGTTDDTAEPSTPTELLSFEVSGTITDTEGNPVAEATVMVGGVPDSMVLTAADGSYTLWYDAIPHGTAAIVAAKAGYRSVGFEFFGPGEAVNLAISEVVPDNPDYTYQDPGDGVNVLKEDCTHCHTTFVYEFLQSGHAEAARSPLLQDLYAGVSAHGSRADCNAAGGTWAAGHDPGTPDGAVDKCYLGGGVLPDLNASCGGDGQPLCDDADMRDEDLAYGACADCHAPGIDGVAGGRDLHDAHGLAYDIGVHCDTCHKVRDVDMSLPPGVGNRLVMGRPSKPGENIFLWEPVYYGPLIDAPNIAMGGSIQPKFDQAVFCAGCHQLDQEALLPGEALDAGRWPDGLPVHTTYQEWQEGPYNREATQCQFCHMPPDLGLNNAVDISTPEGQSILFGFPREPEDVRRHMFRGPLEGSPRLIDQAVFMSLELDDSGGSLAASVSLANIGCGHAIPTGEPMRALLLHVVAEGSCGVLQAVDGMTVPDTGGAWLQGVVGTDVIVADTELEWPGADGVVSAGLVVRAVRPTGAYDDYDGVGFFGESGRTAEEKGLERMAPVGEAVVIAVDGDTVSLDMALPLEDGDWLYIGDDVATVADGDAARHLAGLPGYAFSKVLVDSGGARHVPHHRAVDVASDNRIGPGQRALTAHTFDLPDGCSDVEVRATLIYRPVPLGEADLRGWESVDHVVSTATSTL
jgi:hypothetical protein